MTAGKSIALPYLSLLAGDLSPDPDESWLVSVNGGRPECSGDGLVQSWDASAVLSFSRTFSIRADLRSRLCVTSSDGFFELLVAVSSGRGRSRVALHKFALEEHAHAQVIRFALDSSLLASDVRIVSTLTVKGGVGTNILSPVQAGARLWQDEVRLIIEGGRGRLPMEVVSFAKEFPGQGLDSARLHLELSADLSADVEAGIRVYLNASGVEFIRNLQMGSNEETRYLWQSVVRRLLRQLADDDRFCEVFDPGSIGWNIVQWSRYCFIGISPREMSDYIKADSSRFEAMVDAWIETFPRETALGMEERS